MKIPRVYSTPDGETHIGETEFPDEETRKPDIWTKSIKTGVMEICESQRVHGDWDNYHAPHKRLMAITLAGTHEVITTDGSKHIAGPGDMLVFEDVNSKGHSSPRTTPGPHKIIFIILE